MNIRNRIKRRNLMLNLVAVIIASAIAFHSIADPDYDLMHKDINIMIGIVKSAFENSAFENSASENKENCRSCRIHVTGHYLADQGVVFNVRPASGRHAYAFKTPDFEENVEVFAEGIAAIPLVVEGILEGVETGLANEDFSSFTIRADGDWSKQSRSARQALREARAELREANRELREIEIEAIHAEEDELTELEQRETEILQELERLSREEAQIKENLASQVKTRKNAMQEKRAKRLEVRRQRFEEMETLVLNAFCDYSGTMRSLPKNERINVIVSRDEGPSNIYVFEQSELDDCDSSQTNVRDHALIYAF